MGHSKSVRSLGGGREESLLKKEEKRVREGNQIKLNKIFTHHKITDRIPERVAPVITKVCAESKSWIDPNLQMPNF